MSLDLPITIETDQLNLDEVTSRDPVKVDENGDLLVYIVKMTGSGSIPPNTISIQQTPLHRIEIEMNMGLGETETWTGLPNVIRCLDDLELERTIIQHALSSNHNP